jgi:integrase
LWAPRFQAWLRTAGSSPPTSILTEPTVKSEILAYAWHLKKSGKSEATIDSTVQRLRTLSRLCNILEPEEVKTILATGNQKNTTKNTIADLYTGFVKYKGMKWEKPHFQEEEKLPFIPQEKEIDELISGSGKRLATFLQLLKETGIRTIEARKAEWTDIDTERKTIRIRPAKGSNPRILPITDKLIGMLNRLPKKTNKIFNAQNKTIRDNFTDQRKLIAEKLQNPRLLQIHFHTLRHWKATIEYHKTKDILHVKRILGHKSVTSTEIYINIEQATFLIEADDWTSIVTHNIDEEQKAINTGFQLVRSINETTAIYKKRK